GAEGRSEVPGAYQVRRACLGRPPGGAFGGGRRPGGRRQARRGADPRQWVRELSAARRRPTSSSVIILEADAFVRSSERNARRFRRSVVTRVTADTVAVLGPPSMTDISPK